MNATDVSKPSFISNVRDSRLDVNKEIKEREELKKIYDNETSHRQWKKQGTNFFIFLSLAFFNVFRGSKHSPSFFGVKPCSVADWSSLGVFCCLCILISYNALKKMKHEQYLKVKHGSGLCKSDVEVSGGKLVKLISVSFLGGWVSGALGLGGGSIFNPLLLSMGVPPTVASATGMYMIIFSTAASTITYTLNDALDVDYGLWVGGFCIVGTVAGMQMFGIVMKKLGRQSPLVMLLAFMLGISAVAVVYFGVFEIIEAGGNFWLLGNIC